MSSHNGHRSRHFYRLRAFTAFAFGVLCKLYRDRGSGVEDSQNVMGAGGLMVWSQGFRLLGDTG